MSIIYIMNDLSYKFLATIEEHNMLKKGDSLLISLSGGIDSTVMTHLFNQMRERLGLRLFVFHLNHMLRPREAKAEAKFVSSFCDNLGIKAFISEYDVGSYAKKNKLSVQVAARQLRYRFIEDLQKDSNINKVATAHNADDRVETLLIRLVRGTAGAGMSGLAPVRDGNIIRPLIDATRAEIEEYASENDIAYMTDSSNLKTVYLRNKVRLELLPHLKENYNANIMSSLLSCSKVAWLEDNLIRGMAAEKLTEALTHSEDGVAASLSIPVMKSAHNALLNRVLTMVYYELAPAGHPILFNHVEKLNYLINADKPNSAYCLPGGVTAVRSYDTLTFTREPVVDIGEYELEHHLYDKTVIAPVGLTLTSELVEGGSIMSLTKNKSDNKEYIDYAKLSFPISVRSFRAGDVIRPLNMRGHKKLKDIFIDKKIQIERRRTVPILLSRGEVALVPGICLSDDFKVTDETTTAVCFALD